MGGIAITPAIAGDVMTISVTGAQTTTLGTGRHVFLLTETTGAAAVRIAGRLLLTDSATDSPDTSVTILTSANVSVAVTVVSATLAGAYLPLAGGTLTGALVVPDEVYGAAWNGSLQVPTKNAVYDKIETLGGGGGSTHTIKEDGVALTARAGLNFGAGLTASDDAVNNETDVVIPTGGVTNDMLAGSIALAKLATDPLARANHTGAQAIATVTNLQTTLDAKIPATEKGAANGVATLGADSKIPSAQIPAIALSEFLGNVATEAAMLALVGQRGDWAVRTDFTPNRVFILKTDDPTLAANWTDITTPGAVTSVAGKTGAVTLVKGDVGLGNVDNTADSAKPVSTAQQTALDAKAPSANPVFTGTVTIPDGALAIADTSGLQAALDAKAVLAWNPPPVRKTVDETVNNSTVLQDDDALTLAIGANETWAFEFVLFVDGGASGASADFRSALTVPAGATFRAEATGPGSSATTMAAANGSYAALTVSGTTGGIVGLITSDTVQVTIKGVVVNGATAGSLTLQWAQWTATVTDVIVRAQSHLIGRRIA